MKTYIFLEYKRLLTDKKFKLIFLIFLSLILASFTYTCYTVYGENLSSIRAYYEMSIIQGIPSSFIRSALIILLPLISSIIYSDSYYQEYSTGVYKNIVTKISRKKYLLSKIIVNFSIVFFILFFLLFINELLTLITFPLQGYDSNFSLPSYSIITHNEWFLDILRLSKPYLYNIVIIFNFCLISSILSTLTLVLCFSNTKKWLINCFSVFIFYITLMILSQILKIPQLSFSSYIVFPAVGNIQSFLIIILILVFLILSLLLYSIKKENY